MGCIQSKSKPTDHNKNSSKDKQNGISNNSKRQIPKVVICDASDVEDADER